MLAPQTLPQPVLSSCILHPSRLDTEYVDLMLIHWPGVARLDHKSPDNAKLRLETWRVRRFRVLNLSVMKGSIVVHWAGLQGKSVAG
jgi:diketogulonate reductase-like aldo/keto reductase